MSVSFAFRRTGKDTSSSIGLFGPYSYEIFSNLTIVASDIRRSYRITGQNERTSALHTVSQKKAHVPMSPIASILAETQYLLARCTRDPRCWSRYNFASSAALPRGSPTIAQNLLLFRPQ